MTQSDHESAGAKPRRGVVLPEWEEALRAGQEEAGHAGSLEDELAVVQLFRHARAPETLGDEAVEGIWSDLDRELSPVPWWRRRPVWLGTGLAAAAAAVALVLVWPERTSTDAQTDAGRVATSEDLDALGQTLEEQFALLEPMGREALSSSVEDTRRDLRSDLIAMAKRDSTSAGGAP